MGMLLCIPLILIGLVLLAIVLASQAGRRRQADERRPVGKNG